MENNYKRTYSCCSFRKFNVQYTYGNLNNHIGVPLTILSIKPEHEMAVIEMGANHQKEIEFLCTISNLISDILPILEKHIWKVSVVLKV
jgi:UDP-N-acetylmuramyl pentapeptide synthase